MPAAQEGQRTRVHPPFGAVTSMAARWTRRARYSGILAASADPGHPFAFARSSGVTGPGSRQIPEASDADRAGGSEDHAGQKQGDLEAAKE